MAVFLKGSIWHIDYIDAFGNRIRRSARTTDKQLAEELEAKLKYDSWRVRHLGDKPRMLWKEAVDRFVKEKQNKDMVNEACIFGYLENYFGEMYLDEIRRMHIDALIQKRLKDGVSNTTINRYLQKIRAVFNKAYKEWEVKCKPPYIKLLKESKSRIRYLTKHEAKRLVKALPEHLADMAIFSLETGLRESNVTLLRWDQVDFSRRAIFIEGDDVLKSEKDFVVPLSDAAIQVIKKQVGNHSERVFTFRGKPIRRANGKAFRAALKRAGIENFRWHDLRHTWATWHVQKGTPLEVLQELGGWSDMKTVKRYAHFTPDHLHQYVSCSNMGLSSQDSLGMKGVA